MLALFGWSLQKDVTILLLTCSDCQRRAVAFPSKTFDVSGEHQEYCPWVCERTQDGAMGWVILSGFISACEDSDEQKDKQEQQAPVYDEEESLARLRKLRKQLGLST